MNQFGGGTRLEESQPGLEELIAVARKRLARNIEILNDPKRTPLDKAMARAQKERWESYLDEYMDQWYSRIARGEA